MTNTESNIFKYWIKITIGFVVVVAIAAVLSAMFPGLDLRLVLIPLWVVLMLLILKGVYLVVESWFNDKE